MSNKNKRIDFYKSFLNYNYFRDYRHIQSNGFVDVCYPPKHILSKDTVFKDNRSLYGFMIYDTSRGKGKILNYIAQRTRENYRHDGNLAYSLSFFKDAVSYKCGVNADRFTDRLMFDFDAEDVRLKNLKKELAIVEKKNLTWKEKQKEKAVIQQEFRDLLSDTNILDYALADAKKLANYFHSEGLKTYPVFSGSKGVHLYVFIPPVQSIKISVAVKEYSKMLKEKLQLNTLDLAVVKNIVKGMDRIIYSKHGSTGLYVTPFDFDDDKETILKKSTKQSIGDFDFTDHVVKDNPIVKNLVQTNLLLQKLEQEKREKVEQERVLKRKNVKFTNGEYKKIDIDMRDLVRAYGIDGKNRGDRISVKCPFHDDNYPSAVVNEKGFHCSTCDITYNYYDFISEMEHTTDHGEIMRIARAYSR